MSVVFCPVETQEDIEALARLADEIWHEYWPELIGKAQTDYMVEKFQSPKAIKRDMDQAGYEYWFLRVADEDATEGSDADAGTNAGAGAVSVTGSDANADAGKGRIVGYTGGHDEPETNRFFISKIYLLKEERGQGYASKTIAFYDDLCRSRGLDAMYLTVNKYNELGVRAYRGKGFETIDSVETDIGSGFIMDDFIMQKRVAQA